MPLLASDVFLRASHILQDDTFARWTLPELRLWLNDAVNEIVLQRPQASAKTVVLTMRAGTWQTVAPDHLAILRVVRNLATGSDTARVGGRIVRPISRDILDAQSPDWHDSRSVRHDKTVKHVIYDQDGDPRSFYVYPGNDGTGFVEAVVSDAPTPIAAPTSNPDQIGSYNIAVDLPEIYGNAILDYVLYRAYSKDAQYAPGIARAVAHYQAFATGLGLKIASDSAANVNAKKAVAA